MGSDPKLNIIKGRYTLSGKVKDRDFPYLFEKIAQQQDALDAVQFYQNELNNTESDSILTTNVMVRLRKALAKAEV